VHPVRKLFSTMAAALFVRARQAELVVLLLLEVLALLNSFNRFFLLALCHSPTRLLYRVPTKICRRHLSRFEG
jgi:hypothetical protein